MLLRKPDKFGNPILKEDIERLKEMYQHEVEELNAELELKRSEVDTLLLYEQMKNKLKTRNPLDEYLLNRICDGISLEKDDIREDNAEETPLIQMRNELSQNLRQLKRKIQNDAHQLCFTYIFEEIVTPLYEILSLVQRSTAQINLLALNVADEAAKAEEHSYRFNLIADDVNSLAECAQMTSAELLDFIHKLLKESNEQHQWPVALNDSIKAE